MNGSLSYQNILRKKLLPNEHQIRRSIIDLLNYNGYLAWTHNSGGRKDTYTTKDGRTNTRYTHFGGLIGASDIFALQRSTGRLICIEVKTPAARNRRDKRYFQQESFINLINASGGIAFFAWSIEMVAERLGIKMLF